MSGACVGTSRLPAAQAPPLPELHLRAELRIFAVWDGFKGTPGVPS